MSIVTIRLILLATTWTAAFAFSFKARLSCYDQNSGDVTACFPGDQELAKNVSIEATSTCNSQYLRYIDSANGKVSTSLTDCSSDQSSIPLHPITSAVDTNDQTFWVSGTTGGSDANTDRYAFTIDLEVNVTLDLGVMTEIGQISLTFQSPRPHSMVIMGRNSSVENWSSIQYYSASCYSVFNRGPWFGGYSSDSDSIHCDQRQSDRVPMNGGKIIFEPSKRTQIIRHLQLRFLKLHSIHDIDGLTNKNDNMYYYSISDIAIVGRCFCNGHASFCNITESSNRYCVCQHNTAGANCEMCAKNYHGEPWRSLTLQNSKHYSVKCTRCECNGNSVDCEFDHRVWELNGGRNGGVCINCMNNSLGQNCELCKPGFFKSNLGYCEDCKCNALGSLQTDCSYNGICLCKNGVTGDTCGECLPEYYGFGNEQGCSKCECNPAGTRGGINSCDFSTGQCPCKENVIGQTCSECSPGHFDLRADDVFGCKACFCSNHSTDCVASSDIYKITKMQADFSGVGRQYGFDIAGWKATDLTGSECNLILEGSSNERHLSLDSSASKNGGNCKLGSRYSPIYFQLPNEFVGNKIFSYGLSLSFELKPVGDITQGSFASRDLIIEGKIGNDLKWIAAGLNWQNNPVPTAHQWTFYSFRLDERGRWYTSLSSTNFQSVLLSLERILVRGSYDSVACDIKNVVLERAERDISGTYQSNNRPQFTAERCFCPEGYMGSSCESCAPGFYRLEPSWGYLSACVPCSCNQHGSNCNETTGECKCKHNTQGKDCSECHDGYYGDPSSDASPNACQICPCGFTVDPNTSLSRPGKCKKILIGGSLQCIECPNGYTGDKCQECAKNFFWRNGKCVECDCNGNGAEFDGTTCNQITGECLSCLNNTTGRECERCLDDHYGSALSDPSTCTLCQCSKEGTLRSYSPPQQSCSPTSGACVCKEFVVGQTCNSCAEGYYGFASGKGCFSCDCSPVGSYSSVCNPISGQCPCLPNVSGRTCNQCSAGSYGFNSSSNLSGDGYFVSRSFAGCLDCGCDYQGVVNTFVLENSAVSVQCDDSGSCSPCRANVTGSKCDRCIENHYKFFEVNERKSYFVCKSCDTCYDFVQVAIDRIRSLAVSLEGSIKQIQSTPINFTGENFQQRLTEIVRLATSTLRKAQLLDESTDDVAQYVDEADVICAAILSRLDDIATILQRIDQTNFSNRNTFDKLDSHVQDAEVFIQRMNKKFVEVEILLSEVQRMANEISSNKTQLLDKLEDLEGIADQHEVNASVIANTTRHAQRYTSQSMRMMALILNVEWILRNHTTAIKNHLSNIDPSIGEQLQQSHDYVHSIYEMTLKAFNEFNKPVPEYNFAPILAKTRLLNETMRELDINLRRVNESNVQLGISSADIRNEISELLVTSRDLNRNLSLFLVHLYEMESGLNATVNRVSKDYYSGIERLALLKGYQNNSDSRQSFDEQYSRITSIREDIDKGNEKCSTTSTLIDSQYRRQVKAVSQNAQLNLDGITRKKETAEDVYSKLQNMAEVIDSEKEEMKVIDSTLRKLDAECEEALPLAEAVQRQKEASEKAVAADQNAKKFQSKLTGTSRLLDTLQTAMDSTNFLSADEKSRITDTAAKLKNIFDSFDILEMTKAADEIEDTVSQMDSFLLDYEKRYLQALDDVQNAEEIAAGLKVICQSMFTPIS